MALGLKKRASGAWSCERQKFTLPGGRKAEPGRVNAWGRPHSIADACEGREKSETLMLSSGFQSRFSMRKSHSVAWDPAKPGACPGRAKLPDEGRYTCSLPDDSSGGL